MSNTAEPRAPNQVLGVWRMVSAVIDPDGRKTPAYGDNPSGLLSFTADMHFVEVLTDGDARPFASAARGGGTDEENRRAMAAGIGFFGTYTVDAGGEFSGNRVEGSTFPNWVGAVRTRADLSLTVSGDDMAEAFRRPDGTAIRIHWRRAR